MGRRVPLARRQLVHEPLKLALTLAGVALAVALVGLLFALREGIGRQVTTFEDNAVADAYGMRPGDVVRLRGRPLRVVGLTDRTASWMTPRIFVTRAAANELQG